MDQYLYCNQVIASTLPLAGLPLVAGASPRITFHLAAARLQEGEATWHHRWHTPAGQVVLAYRPTPGCHELRFPSLADFSISSTAHRITCHPLPNTPPETLHHLLLDQVLPRCLAHQGMLMLHASAVSLPGGVALFLGATGQGKSTLAGYFHRSGYPALSDDCVRLQETPEGVKVIPSYGGLRLWPDAHQFLYPDPQETTPMAHYSSKQRLPLSGSDDQLQQVASQEGFPLQVVIVLSTQEDQSQASTVQLARLPLRQAFIEIMRQAFLLEVSDHAQYIRLMQAIGQIVPRVGAYTLSLPHDYQLLPQVQQAILDQIAVHLSSQP